MGKGQASFPLALSIAPLVVLVALAAVRGTFPLDDAYITLHNARVLLTGGLDPVYSGSTALTGATSAAHLGLIAATGLVLPLPLASKLVSLIGICLYAAGLTLLLRRLATTPTVTFALYVSGLFLGYMPYHLLNGLETGLALAAIVWALLLMDSKWLPLLCGTLPFVRPELAFLAAPLLARRFWLDRTSLRKLGLSTFLVSISVLPWLLLYWNYTGSPVPNTGGAKIEFFAEARLSWLERTHLLATAFIGCLIGPLWLSFPTLWRSAAGMCTLLFLLCWIGSTVFVFPGGFHHNHFRYLSLVVPVLILGWGQLLAREHRLGNSVAIGLLVWTLVTGIVGIRAYLDRSQVQALEQAARVIDTKVSGDAVILVHDAGYLAWTLPHHRLV
jgi:hypothetical protein